MTRDIDRAKVEATLTKHLGREPYHDEVRTVMRNLADDRSTTFNDWQGMPVIVLRDGHLTDRERPTESRLYRASRLHVPLAIVGIVGFFAGGAWRSAGVLVASVLLMVAAGVLHAVWDDEDADPTGALKGGFALVTIVAIAAGMGAAGVMWWSGGVV